MLVLRSRDEIAEIIRRERKRRPWSQTELAEQIGNPKGQGQVSRWETGKERPTPSSLHRISDALDLDWRVFFRDVDPADLKISEARIIGTIGIKNEPVLDLEPDARPRPKEVRDERGGYTHRSPFAHSWADSIERQLDHFRVDRSKVRVHDLVARMYRVAISRRWPFSELRELDAWRDWFLRRCGYEQSWEPQEDRSAIDPSDREGMGVGPFLGWRARDVFVLDYVPEGAYRAMFEEVSEDSYPTAPSAPDAESAGDVGEASDSVHGTVEEGSAPQKKSRG